MLETLWPQLQTLRQRLSSHYEPAAGAVAEQFGFNRAGAALLLRAYAAAPQPISASRLGGWNPYTNPWTYEAGLQHLAAVGLLMGEPEGDFALTEAGRAAAGRLLAAIAGRLCDLAPLDAAARERLAGLLERLAAASLAAPEPPRKTLLRLAQRLAADSQGHPMVRLNQALAGLAAYRDDCRRAAWEPLMVSGPAWEALGALWRGLPGTLDEVYGQMLRRGWPRETYARALQELVRRDWVAGPEPYTLTPQGRTLRERAEAQTHRDFFAPWQALEPEGLAVLRGLLPVMSAALVPAEASV